MTSPTVTGGPDFLIVGSARSGTTLAQRLACELPGVGMPPETHFFDVFVPQFLQRRRPPLVGAGLRDAIEHWRGMDEVRGLDVDPDTVMANLGGSAASLIDLFDALVRALAPPSQIYGEKTPKHLLWWRPLTRARPQLKILAIVRDPRSVVASNLAAPWARGISPFDWGDDLYVAMAERWRVEQEQTLEMAGALGRRCLVLRHEDVVADPVHARALIGSLLGITISEPYEAKSSGSSIVLPWETWKATALGDITAGRASAWMERLGRRRGHVVSAVCGRSMRSLGYRTSVSDRLAGVVASATLDPRTQRRRLAYRRLLRCELEWINRETL